MLCFELIQKLRHGLRPHGIVKPVHGSIRVQSHVLERVGEQRVSRPAELLPNIRPPFSITDTRRFSEAESHSDAASEVRVLWSINQSEVAILASSRIQPHVEAPHIRG